MTYGSLFPWGTRGRACSAGMVFATLFLAAIQAHAATIVVTTNAPTGAGSLEDAILQLSSATEASTITFNLVDNFTIFPTAQLPTINSSHPVLIDGGNAVVLNGENLAVSSVGLAAGTDNITIRGLTIVNFGSGIFINGADAVVESCRIGTDGATSGAGNVLGNDRGIWVSNSAQYTRIGGVGVGNVISGNETSGIFLDNTFDVTIQGNHIGMNALGTVAIPNFGIGIRGTNSNMLRIGGDTLGEGNLISGNGNFGINLNSCSSASIEGNVIGLNGARDTLVQNAGGIFFAFGPNTGSFIRNNIICGSSSISVRSSTGLSIQNNFLGTNGPGGPAITSVGTAITIDASGGSTSNIIIGGEGGENIIANYTGYAFELFGANVSTVRISRNAIFNNALGGMNFWDGANNSMPAPTILGVDPVSGTAQANAEVEFFADTGNQGRTFLGRVQASGAGSFNTEILDLAPYVGQNLTATATDLNGNTSPFSAPFTITSVASPPEIPDMPYIADPSDITSTSITWSFDYFDDSADGLRIFADPFTGSPSTLRATLSTSATSYTFSGRTPNTQYSLALSAYNDGAESLLSSPSHHFTLAGPAVPGENVTATPGPDFPTPTGTDFTFSNPAGFGVGTDGGNPHRVSFYRYVWNTAPVANVSSTDTAWLSSTLQLSGPTPGNYYLHLRSYNEAQAPSETVAFGPFVVVGEGEGEGSVSSGIHTADQNGNNVISLSELLRVIQFFNSGGLHCVVAPTTSEDGYLPGINPAAQSCTPHASDYNPTNWLISLSELLRLIQFFNSGGYFACPDNNTEDGYCVGSP